MGRLGGGVAIAVRQDIEKNVTQVQDLEDQEQEIVWAQINQGTRKTFIGVYYGPQETANNEDVEKEYSQIYAQITKLKKERRSNPNGRFQFKSANR